MRTELRKVTVSGETFLYPFPIIKTQKYLIQVPESKAEFFTFCILNKIIPSPDATPEYLAEVGVHTDGNTPIYEIQESRLEYKVSHLTTQTLQEFNNLRDID